MTIVRERGNGSDAGPDIVALLPLRSLRDGKLRLAHRLTVEQRGRLIVTLSRHVVTALRTSGVVAAIAIISGDELALEFGRELGVETISEGEPGLNVALRTGGAWAVSHGAAVQLIVLPDLPLLSADDVVAVAQAGQKAGTVVLCPDRSGTGTNMLLMRPGGLIPPLFGPNSYARHLAAAQERGLNIATYESPGTQWDIDTPEDLAELGMEL